MAKNIKKRSEDYAQWYLDVIKAAKLADYAPVRGCMVVRPEGFAIWEAIQRGLDRRFKATGHVNAYFPMLIPQSFLTKEAEHVEGFAMECAIVTHSKLEKGADGKLAPGGKLEEPYIIRPTSETLFGHMYAQWVQSYRDLPLLINQWCSVMRWELRTRLFLRTAEFLWQEGHTAHETEKEAHEETLKMLDVYAEFAENVLAVPVIKGAKSDAEKFPGAKTTYCIEALMQDGKALQMGTSHDLGQNFAKAFDIKFLSRENKQEHAWTTSWGVSTRMIGALIMAHSDDEGLVLPPRVAPVVAAIVPIFKTPEEEAKVRSFVEKVVGALMGKTLSKALSQGTGRGSGGAQAPSPGIPGESGGEGGAEGSVGQMFSHHGIDSYLFDASSEQRIIADFRDARPGDKQYHWEQRGVPFRIEVGPRDVDGESFVLKSRIEGTKEIIKLADISRAWIKDRLDRAQQMLFDRAKKLREENTRDASTYDELKKIIAEQGGFVRCWFNPDRANEAKIKEETKATLRVIPFEQTGAGGKDIITGAETKTRVLFALAY